MASLYLKTSGIAEILQVGGALAVSSACCCVPTQTNTCAQNKENCTSGIAPISLLASVSLTTNGDDCDATCQSEGAGSWVLTIQDAATHLSAGSGLECGSSISIPEQCYWAWSANSSFSANAPCQITGSNLVVELLKYNDGNYYLHGQLDMGWSPGGARVEAEFKSSSLGSSPVNCVTALDGVTLNWICTNISTKCGITAGSITISV